MTQPMLVARLNLLGWGISRETLAKIETQLRWIADAELFCVARALNVSPEKLFGFSEKEMRSFFRQLSRD
jgi:Holliday junction resolvasome RuvABC DNA-binding subunit